MNNQFLKLQNWRFSQIIQRELELNPKDFKVTGFSSILPLVLSLSEENPLTFNILPHIIIVPSEESFKDLNRLFQFACSTAKLEFFRAHDVSPFSGLDPLPRTTAERMRFLYALQNAQSNQIFVTTTGALLQKTIPFKEFKKYSFKITESIEFPVDPHSFFTQRGYRASPVVEDFGQYTVRGGIIDFFSPNYDRPIRLELFGDQVESIRFFNSLSQASEDKTSFVELIPAREAIYLDEMHENVLSQIQKKFKSQSQNSETFDEIFRSLSKKNYFPQMEFLLPYFYKRLESPLEHLNSEVYLWNFDPLENIRIADEIISDLKLNAANSTHKLMLVNPEDLYSETLSETLVNVKSQIRLSSIDYLGSDTSENSVEFSCGSYPEFSKSLLKETLGTQEWSQLLNNKLNDLISAGYRIFWSFRSKTHFERAMTLFEQAQTIFTVLSSNESRSNFSSGLYVWESDLPESCRIKEDLVIFLRDEDLFGKKVRVSSETDSEKFQKQTSRLNFSDLKAGDLIVHQKHGIGVYDGLTKMQINGIVSEFIQLHYKEKEKLYLPVFRINQIQKYSGAAGIAPLDKLGGTSWEKVKVKVKGHLRDVAHELLKIYAMRAEKTRPRFNISQIEWTQFASEFAFDETRDQLKAIEDLRKDLVSQHPMDRLICGDVGFGKTEVAMRAAFAVVRNNKQVAILAPTTVLSFQHFENFKKRFSRWPVEIRALNRFVSPLETKKTLQEIKNGVCQILIGTHRILSKDIEFKNLGLLIVDEEQKFGVLHKERIKKLKVDVDTLTMSATPIPRTLNMSLNGIRDLSLINTAPIDRVPTRTFVSAWDDEAIRRAIESEIKRGGQVYFIHNRVQSIYELADRVRVLVPDCRIRIGHGQMEEHELEKTMIAFFNHEIDVLICTTIVESGMDVSRANTMIIDNAHQLGLSQLYQLRGRVGRSRERAYCYLLVPKGKKLEGDAQERLKVLQENTALGSGIRIAQYDLELRGSGNILGEEQSGHVDSVGYEMYTELLRQALAEAKGEAFEDQELDPEVNLKIPALIPDQYMPDLRHRLSYYKALSEIRSQEDLDDIEGELKDQFGEPPSEVLNLMGLMLIRRQCKDLGVRDISAGIKNISLIFTDRTKIKPETVIKLITKENKKYSVTPDQRLNIRLNTITWPAVYEELQLLLKLI